MKRKQELCLNIHSKKNYMRKKISQSKEEEEEIFVHAFILPRSTTKKKLFLRIVKQEENEDET